MLSEKMPCDSIGKYCALVRPHHILQIEREQAFDDKVFTTRTVKLNKAGTQLCLVVGGVGNDKYPPAGLDDLDRISDDLVSFPRAGTSDP
ncbi:hypothetical protein D3C84_1138620 [compost metagenome]